MFVQLTNRNLKLGRRENPDYSRVTGLIDRNLAKRLRLFVVEEETTTISEIIEIALKRYLDEEDANKSNQKNNKESK